MSEVKRYDSEGCWEVCGGGGMEEASEGEYVTYEDYQKLEEENQRHREALEFYARDEHHDDPENNHTNFYDDRGETAKQALRIYDQ